MSDPIPNLDRSLDEIISDKVCCIKYFSNCYLKFDCCSKSRLNLF